MQGLASDGGLLIPEEIPFVSKEELAAWGKLDRFQDVAFNIVRKFVKADEINDDDMRNIIENAYTVAPGRWRDQKITPVRKFEGLNILELFHGPTFAFKDVALQFLGRLFEHILKEQEQASEAKQLTILAATSGDTGSSAIHGLRGLRGVECFVLFPKEGPRKYRRCR